MDTTFEEISDTAGFGGEGEKNSIAEALQMIDRGLGQMLHRELVSTAEATDLLLDVRALLAPLSSN